MLNQIIIIITSFVLFPAAFISLGINIGYSAYGGLGVGLAIALLSVAGLVLQKTDYAQGVELFDIVVFDCHQSNRHLSGIPPVA